MAVIRVNKTSNYTIMSNCHFCEKEMSLKAKGLLSLMLSLPDDWDYSINGLATLSKDGKESVMSALSELEQFGYLIRTKTTDSKGRFSGYDYDIFEHPQPKEPYTENPNTDEPNTAKPNTENPAQLNTKQSKTKKPNKEKQNTKKTFVPPTLEEVEAYCRERNNNVDAKAFVDYFDAADWVDSKGNPVRSWKQKVITWENFHKQTPNPNASISNGTRRIPDAIKNRVSDVDNW